MRPSQASQTVRSVSVIGTQGLPPRHGGFETCVYEVGRRHADLGVAVTVYCRGSRDSRTYAGMRLVGLPAIPRKHLETLSNAFLSVLHSVRFHPDVVHLYGVGNAVLLPLLKVFGRRVVVSVDGLDSRRSKWGASAKLYLRVAERLACIFADEVIVDSRVVQAHYLRVHHRATSYIPYGASTEAPAGVDALMIRGLRPRRYVLFVGRLEPEKNVEMLIRGYTQAAIDMPLVIIGGSRFPSAYSSSLEALAGPQVKFLGFVYGQEYLELVANAYVYVQPSRVEGTSPALLTAMGLGNCVIVNGIEENLETVGDAGVSVPENDTASLAAALRDLAADEQAVVRYRDRARERVRRFYDWDAIARSLLDVYFTRADQLRREALPGDAA